MAPVCILEQGLNSGRRYRSLLVGRSILERMFTFRRRFMALTENYRTSDFVMLGVDMRADLTNLPLEDGSVDILFASYIL
jgi:hypothetical protein